MKTSQFFILVFAVLSILPSFAQLPDHFVGTWEHYYDEGVDEWLQSKGIGWFQRQLFHALKPTKIFEKHPENESIFHVTTLTSLQHFIWPDIQLGQEFVGERIDGHVEIVFAYDCYNDKLIERHIPIYDPFDVPDVMEYMRVRDELHMDVDTNGVCAKFVFKKAD